MVIPLILVKKKDDSFRISVDYRKLNKVMRKEEWPLPRINDILESFGGAKYFSIIDLKSGF
jgi:putative transposase